MSVNAFYDAFGAAQNALGDPRGDAERRRRQEMQDAMAQQQFQMQRQQFEAQAEAQRRAQETARIQAEANRAQYGGLVRPRPAMPTQAQQMAPQGQMQPMQPSMVGGAPIAPQEPDIDPVSGKTIDRQVVQGMQQPKFSQSEALQQRMQYLAEQNRWDLVGEIAPLYQQALADERKASLAEEDQGYQLYRETLQQIGAWATSIIPDLENIDPKSNWQPQIMASVRSLAQNLNRMGLDGNVILQQVTIDPGETPQSVAQELREIAATAFSEDAAKRFFSKPDIVNTGREQVQVGGAGDVLNRFTIGIPQETIFKENQANARNAADNITSERNSRRSAGSDATKPPTGYVLNPPPVGGR
ncbi:MAG: hypothetical protein ING71_17310 [Rhodocyclaceae bacterium]|nr:hypothetical protein [Rhodocyclaceae bacterium]